MAEHARPTHAVSDGAAPAKADHQAEPAPALPTPLTGLALRRAAGGDALGGGAIPPDVTATLSRRRGQGSKLPSELASGMGAELGTDLSGVRVHTGGEADHLARSVNAVAFTSGTDVYFRSGAYQPGHAQGQHLIAHELAHIAHQGSGADRGATGTIGRADDPAEQAADDAACRVVQALRRRTVTPPHHQEPAFPASTPLRRRFVQPDKTPVTNETVAGIVQADHVVAGKLAALTGGKKDAAWVVKKIADGPDAVVTDAASVLAVAEKLATSGPFFDPDNGAAGRKLHRLIAELQQKAAELAKNKAAARIAGLVDEILARVSLTEMATMPELPMLQGMILDGLAAALPEFEKDPRGAWLVFSTLSQFGSLSYVLCQLYGVDPDKEPAHQKALVLLRALRQAMAGKDQLGVVAHRGAGPTNRTMGGLIAQDDQRRSSRPAENSPEAFDYALTQVSQTVDNEGLDGIECDVYLSSDGYPIITHEGDVLEQLSTEQQGVLQAKTPNTKVWQFTAEQVTTIQRTARAGSRFMTLAELIAKTVEPACRFYERTGRPLRLEIEMKGSAQMHGVGGSYQDQISADAKLRLGKGGRTNYLHTAVLKEVSKVKKQLPGVPIDFVVFNGIKDEVAAFSAARQQKTALGDMTVGMNYKPDHGPAMEMPADELRMSITAALGLEPEALANFIVTGVFDQEFAPPEMHGLRTHEPSKELLKPGKQTEVGTALKKRAKGEPVKDEMKLRELGQAIAAGRIDVRHFRMLTDYPAKASYLKRAIAEAQRALAVSRSGASSSGAVSGGSTATPEKPEGKESGD